MDKSQKTRYNKAVNKVLAIRDKTGRMPTWRELETILGKDLDIVIKGLGVKSSKELSIGFLREIRRREGKSENILDDYIYSGKSPMANPEKRLSGTKAHEAHDRMWAIMMSKN